MTFKRAVEKTPQIAQAFCSGLRALTKADRSHITAKSTITGSVNLDNSLQQAYPDAPRWDYGVGVQVKSGIDKAVWIEIHPATSHEVDLIIRKYNWLQTWLMKHAWDLKKMSDQFVWIASGKSDIPATSPARKKLGNKGIDFKGGHFIIENLTKSHPKHRGNSRAT
jgi:hypothetical protein